MEDFSSSMNPDLAFVYDEDKPAEEEEEEPGGVESSDALTAETRETTKEHFSLLQLFNGKNIL